MDSPDLILEKGDGIPGRRRIARTPKSPKREIEKKPGSKLVKKVFHPPVAESQVQESRSPSSSKKVRKETFKNLKVKEKLPMSTEPLILKSPYNTRKSNKRKSEVGDSDADSDSSKSPKKARTRTRTANMSTVIDTITGGVSSNLKQFKIPKKKRINEKGESPGVNKDKFAVSTNYKESKTPATPTNSKDWRTNQRKRGGSPNKKDQDEGSSKRALYDSTGRKLEAEKNSTVTQQTSRGHVKESKGVLSPVPKTKSFPRPVAKNPALALDFKTKAKQNVLPSSSFPRTTEDQLRQPSNKKNEDHITSPYESMDFDNPVPEILQLVTEANSIQKTGDVADAMDVDLSDQIQRKQIVVIPDTNVWIDNIPLLKEILKLDGGSMSSNAGQDIADTVNILIPWMVLQEIDHNIHKNSTSKKGQFQNAAKFIHSQLSLKDGRVRGQKAIDAVIGIEFNEIVADDSILNCVIQHDKMPQFITVFLTNDINLLNKALVHNLNAFKADKSFIRQLHNLMPYRVEANALKIPIFNPQPIETNFISHIFSDDASISQNKTPDLGGSLEDFTMDVDDPMGMGNDDCGMVAEPTATFQTSPSVKVQITTPAFETVMDDLRKSLTHIIVPKMVEEYGNDGWRFAIKIKPPFTVESGLRCLEQHWIAVFSYMFPSRAKEILDQLLDSFRSVNSRNSDEDLKSWRANVCKMAVILLSMNDTLVKKPRISETVAHLKAYVGES